MGFMTGKRSKPFSRLYVMETPDIFFHCSKYSKYLKIRLFVVQFSNGVHYPKEGPKNI
jgi:hypothetical protein